MKIKASDLTNGKQYDCKIVKETTCYYTVDVLGYYTNGHDCVVRIHKNTMYIDHMHLSFFIVEEKCIKIEIEPGVFYQSYWGGRLLTENNPDFPPFCTVRKYHQLTKLTIEGKEWIKEYQIDENHPGERSAHHDYFSVCGYYHIAVYHTEEGKPHFMAYKASTHRKHMKSTFGNYVRGIHNMKFDSFELAAMAINCVEREA